ncbi:hypothetical protein REPUB_Repub08aG0089800 [Reevesia pubescens]
METKNTKHKLKNMGKRLRFENKCYVRSMGLSGGLALWWRREIKVKILVCCKYIIETEVVFGDAKISDKIFCAYEPLDFDERIKIWDLIKKKIVYINRHWMCMRDFYDFLFDFEMGVGIIRSLKR